LILHPNDKPRTADDIDSIVSAELPNENEFPLAYATVKRCMIHGPCRDQNGTIIATAPCIVDGKCTKKYPKPFVDETSFGDESYPVYRRLDDGREFVGSNGIAVSNRWVVPHNVYLCTKYDAHINVEICTTISAVKYLYKYVYKGHDRAVVEVSSVNPSTNHPAVVVPEERNEITEFIDARYISASEAFWRLFSFSLHSEFPAHQRLAIHLPNEQPVYFQETMDPQQVLNRNPSKSTLIAWFEYNQANAHGRSIVYPNFPKQFVWHSSPKEWRPRQRGFGGTIGRVYSVSPRDSEKYHLRLLLFHVPGATSFQALRTVNGVIHETFKAAAGALGLLADDEEWDNCLTEAETYRLPRSLRNLFQIILLFCDPSNPHFLWMKYRASMAEDYTHTINSNNQFAHLTNDDAYDMCLLDISDGLASSGFDIFAIHEFVRPAEDLRSVLRQNNNFGQESRLIREQLEFVADASTRPNPAELDFNADQRNVFDSIMGVITDPMRDDPGLDIESKLFFVDGPGGTGKTFLFNALLTAVRRQGGIALAVASSGTASLLLEGGRTAHSRFKIPLDVNETSSCGIKPRSPVAELLRRTKLIVWDECSMISRHLFEAVDRTFKDVFKADNPVLERVPFGGRVLVLGGDFRQVLPVVHKGLRADIVNQCLNRSSLWSNVRRFRLSINMRVQQAQVDNDEQLAVRLQNFAEFLLRVSNGSERTYRANSWIRIPDEISFLSTSVRDLSQWVFGNLTAAELDTRGFDWLSTRAILTPKNTHVRMINDVLLDDFSGVETVYLSSDTVSDENDAMTYPVEFLNTIDSGGLPDHRLKLKIGCPIMLLRNLDPSNGLCNGTRLIVRTLRQHVVEATVAVGTYAGNNVMIPRITFIPTDTQSPVAFKRRQFPIRVAFCMTINKSQGQTLNQVGLYLPDSVFSHGQLYVAFSRVKTPDSIRILTTDPHSRIDDLDGRYTNNVVYSEIF
jgi:hypothetical protein